MVKDEADVIEYTLRQMVNEGVDGILVADNMSTDDTAQAVQKVASISATPIVLITDDDRAYYQSAKMTALAHRVRRDFGADWVVPFDADECWYSRDGSLKEVLENRNPDVFVVQATLYNHWVTALDGDSQNPFEAMVYREAQPGALPKVACRWHSELVIEAGNHGAAYGRTLYPRNTSRGLELRHFPYRSPEQFLRKARNGAAALALTDLPAHSGAHWRQYGELIDRFGEEAFIRDVYGQYYFHVSPTDAGMVHDPAPFERWAR
jgi:glycosyltransferase involved in cell wall biosynthesis